MDKILVAAIDLGTNYSGYAFSFRHQNERDRIFHFQERTCVLFNPSGTFDSFGYNAEEKYTSLQKENKHQEWYFFKRFKMLLDVKVDAWFDIEDDNGLKMPARKVFGMAIGHLKNDLLHTLARQGTDLSMENIHWVLPVPTTWTVSAKEFIREAANEAGIDRCRLTIIQESKAAAMYYQPHLNVDTKHVVLDIGDERVNITVLKNESDITMNVVYTVSDRSMGGSKVNESYKQMISEIIEDQTFTKFCDDNNDGYMEMLKELEFKKKMIRTDKNEKITLTAWDPIHIINEEKYIETLTHAIQQSRYRGLIECIGTKLRFDADLFRSLFHRTISKITTNPADILDTTAAKGTTAILMVGRYSDCQLMQDAIKKAFPYIKITIPKDGDLTALKGAVIFGHSSMLTSQQDEDEVSSDDIANLSTYSKEGSHHDQAEKTKYNSLSEEEEELSSTPALETHLANQKALKTDIIRAPSDEELFKLARKLEKLTKNWWLLAKLLGLSDEKIDEMDHGGGDAVRQYYKMLTTWKRQNAGQEKGSTGYLLGKCVEAGIDQEVIVNIFGN